MKRIDARNQIALSLGRCVQLAVSGMSYRLLRSSITTAIFALAVAFLVYVLTFGVMSQRTQARVWDRLGEQRRANAWLAHLTTVSDPATLRDELVGPDRVASRRRQYRRWLGLENRELSPLLPMAERVAGFETWSRRLDPSASAVLLGGEPAAEVFAWLVTDPARRRGFARQLAAVKVTDPVGGEQAWRALAEPWRAARGQQERLRREHGRAIAALAAADPRPMLERLAEPTPTLVRELADAGFIIDPAALASLQAYARDQLQIEAVQSRLREPEVGPRVAGAWGSTELEAVLGRLSDPEALADWRRLTGDPADASLTGVAGRAVQRQRLSASAQGYEPRRYATPFGLPPRSLWLVGLSLLVCVVGVSNALLMSVTERFSEIATMKCLGALDASVMRVFVIEALIQGLVGGAVGLAVGLGLAVLRGVAEYGRLFGLAVESLPAVAGAAGLALAVGVVLAAVAAVLPAWIASRLAPMEAMRVE